MDTPEASSRTSLENVLWEVRDWLDAADRTDYQTKMRDAVVAELDRLRSPVAHVVWIVQDPADERGDLGTVYAAEELAAEHARRTGAWFIPTRAGAEVHTSVQVDEDGQ